MMGPALAGSPRVQGHRDYVIKTLLHGMTGPLAGQTYTQVMLPMGAQNDQWIANVASYIRNEFGNTAAFVAPADVARVRAATASRKAMWTYPELEVTLPRLLPVDPTWKATASHNAERAASGLTLAAWTTGDAAGAGHVVPGRAAAAGDGHRSAVRRRRARRRRSWPRRPRRAASRGTWRRPSRRAGARRRPRLERAGPGVAPAAPQRGAAPGGGRGGAPVVWQLPDRLQGAAVDGRQDLERARRRRAQGSPATIVATFRPVQAKFVRVTQTGTAENAPGLVGAELPGLCERERALAEARVYGVDGGNGQRVQHEETNEDAPETNTKRPVAPRYVRCHSPAVRPATRPVCWSSHRDSLRASPFASFLRVEPVNSVSS